MRLLLAEDEKEMAHALEAVFTHNHYSVDVVYNGIDAADWAESGNYDGIILDIMMPGKSGLEVLSELRKKGNHVPWKKLREIAKMTAGQERQIHKKQKLKAFKRKQQKKTKD